MRSEREKWVEFRAEVSNPRASFWDRGLRIPIGVDAPPGSGLPAEDCNGGVTGRQFHPPANRGWEVTSSAHGATVSIFSDCLSVLELLAAHFIPERHWEQDAEEFFEEKSRSKHYARILVGPGGVTVACEPITGPQHVSVNFPGAWFDANGLVRFAGFLHQLEENEQDGGPRWHCTRFDWAFDYVPFTPAKFLRAIQAGNVRTRLKLRRRAAWVEDGDNRKPMWGWNVNEYGQTAYLGHRESSGGQIRVYNRRGFTRCEQEARGQRAKTMGKLLACSDLTEWPVIAMGLLRGFVDVIDRAADENVSRCPLLPWWEKFVGAAQKLTITRGQDERRQVESAVAKRARLQARLAKCVRLVKTWYSVVGEEGRGVVDALWEVAEVPVVERLEVERPLKVLRESAGCSSLFEAFVAESGGHWDPGQGRAGGRRAGPA